MNLWYFGLPTRSPGPLTQRPLEPLPQLLMESETMTNELPKHTVWVVPGVRDRGKPLTAMMDNVIASRMGQIAREAAGRNAGDYIDTGLILLRLLNEAGLDVVRRPSPTTT